MRSIPVTILGGSDHKPSPLPASGADLHPLATYKGAAIRVGGRALVELLVERLAAVEGFGPIQIAGPTRIFGPLGLDARIVETDGSVGVNLRAAIEAHTESNTGVMAVIACDVLPTIEELSQLRARFEEARSCALWVPFVREPRDPAQLGAFGWKPVYRVIPSPGADPIRILPGHLAIFDPGALRLPLLYRLVDTAYRTRNHSVAYRRAVMLRNTFASLLARDIRLLMRLRLPSRTVTVVSSGMKLASALRSGTLQLDELEALIGRIFLRSFVHDDRSVRYPIVEILSLAADVDTEEEASQLEDEFELDEGRFG